MDLLKIVGNKIEDAKINFAENYTKYRRGFCYEFANYVRGFFPKEFGDRIDRCLTCYALNIRRESNKENFAKSKKAQNSHAEQFENPNFSGERIRKVGVE